MGKPGSLQLLQPNHLPRQPHPEQVLCAGIRSGRPFGIQEHSDWRALASAPLVQKPPQSGFPRSISTHVGADALVRAAEQSSARCCLKSALTE